MWRGRPGADDGSDEGDQETRAASQASSQVVLSQEELDRRVQSETDRREYRRQQAAQEAERRRLRDEDPWAYAEQDRTAEQAAQANGQISTLFSQIGTAHDQHTLDPLVMQLPDAERQRILGLQGAGLGLAGRKLIVEEGLKALEKHWKAEGAKEAESRLRRNPAFRKQVLGETRRGLPEPEFLTGGASSSDATVSNILRNQIQGRHSSA